MPVTLSDVAQRSGVSVATVSRVLNNKMVMPIPESTIARIRAAAEELNYRPNRLARALATGRTHTLGLYSEELTDPHFAQMLEAAEARAAALGYQLIVSTSMASLQDDGRTDGTIVLSTPERVSETVRGGRPVVYVNQARVPTADLIAWDDAAGMRQAVEHLAGLGHRRAAALWCYGEPWAVVHPKVAGFREAASERGIEAIECWERESAHPLDFGAQFEDGYRAVRRLLDRGEGFTAVVARNDFLALGALRALHEARIRVPDDVSVVGYNDSIPAICAYPSITSVRTPIAEAGELAVERLVASLDDPASPFAGTLLSTTLVVRESTGPAPAAPVTVVRTRAGYLTTREVPSSLLR